jgi:hypothetical protein
MTPNSTSRCCAATPGTSDLLTVEKPDYVEGAELPVPLELVSAIAFEDAVELRCFERGDVVGIAG